MKFFFVHICIRSGGYAYGEVLVTQARNIQAAEKVVKGDLLVIFGDVASHVWEREQLYLDDQTVKLESIIEISQEEYEVLVRYVPNAVCCGSCQMGYAFLTMLMEGANV